MVLYLLNSLIVPFEGQEAEFQIKKINFKEARDIVNNAGNIVSAIGHSATANILSNLLGIPVQTSRIAIYFKPGDNAIAFVLKRRLEEGQVIQTEEELNKIGYDLYYILRIR
ncbi:DUF1874 domain-containing protein [Saccharolobus solfataricus rod-shaped virus 1]|uniref:DUF1874 domain-containing protein n=1 Tax=Saccharolobus solfataricus rod-shaped virus 1 TaxID=2730619 RepID=A0A6M3VYX8_SSRV1|nr:DUF1874 domain-containing protein [Saccharolobus solfataricus rod-shaped virus 1]QJF12309.1 DUF1874 domain-containing protein [Saccharolobus solfataricus rod-shaped virus 1]